ncbi:protein kinase domain containing protein [Stylonychia lemnae]|uniref:Casein kinase I n=1 Tax=Stylonychia lemnae TaxID=5949 RepID=A0A078AC88_STYLE|nr:protein kinase domain containing protein [Stylonychia lemnae]|eukprot:CDW79217.1 protein kinase domain containing protein [Stylonychia lemnae]
MHAFGQVELKGEKSDYKILDFCEQTLEDGSINFSRSDLALQMLQQLENLHRMGLIHRDVKLENFMIKDNQVYLIDFGASLKYKDGENHIPFKSKSEIYGTPYAASLNSHRCFEVARADDLISLIYSLLWLWEVELPWKEIALNQGQYQEYENDQLFAPIYQSKSRLKLKDLKDRDSKILFYVLKYYLEEMQDLQFDNKDIDYEFIKKQFSLFVQNLKLN